MTPVKSVNLDELSLIYPIMGKLKSIFWPWAPCWKLKVQRIKTVPTLKWITIYCKRTGMLTTIFSLKLIIEGWTMKVSGVERKEDRRKPCGERQHLMRALKDRNGVRSTWDRAAYPYCTLQSPPQTTHPLPLPPTILPISSLSHPTHSTKISLESLVSIEHFRSPSLAQFLHFGGETEAYSVFST